MVCHHPLYANKVTYPDGTVKVHVIGSVDKYIFDWSKQCEPSFRDGCFIEPLILKCGQCHGCQLENSRTWAVRCIHESSLWPENEFITLTYDDVHLPADGSLHKEHLQKFFKRLRKSIEPVKIRYFACGEYGSQFSRPHYHAIVFNHCFDDAQLFSIRGKTRLFVSNKLQRLWPFGYSTIGSVTFESAAYVARYVLKKVNGKLKDFYYDGLQPEFVVMSRRPGIAYDWIKQFKDDVYPNDFVVIRDNIKCKPPKYYDMIYDRDLNGDLEYIKNKRADLHRDYSWSDIERNKKFIETKIKKRLKRNYEENIS